MATGAEPAREDRIASCSQPNAPLFLISFRQRDELAAAVAQAGWRPIAARRIDNAAQRFILSGAGIALVDARGARDEGLEAVRALGDPCEGNAAALMVLLSKTDIGRAPQFLDAGATHYLASPFGDAELGDALRFAERHVERLLRGFGASESVEESSFHWFWRKGAENVEIGERAAALLGLARDKALGAFLAEIGEGSAEATIRGVAQTGRPSAFAHDVVGVRIVHHLSVERGGVTGRIELPSSEAQPKNLTTRDRLTGFADGHGVRAWIEGRLGEPGVAPRLVLVLIGLSRVGSINAALGQSVGDDLLREIARRIEQAVGPMPGQKRLLARLAGAQFAIGLTPPATLDDGELLGRAIVAQIEAPMAKEAGAVRIRARCGVYAAAGEAKDAGAVIRRAGVALAQAENANVSVIAHGPGDSAIGEELSRLEIDLGAALERDEIEILFQPQVTVATGHIVGVEALARWRHPELGELGAAALFAAAERSDYLIDLSHHVQDKALRMAALWPRALAGLRLSINVVPAELGEDGFCERMLALPDATGFPIERLTLEVTERGLVADLEQASHSLARLRSAGMRIAVDDFGTGYSSLAYLKALPLDYLKLDKRLSDDVSGAPRDRVIVNGVIDMARSLGLSVIAEGVETETQLSALTEQGCALYQGFLCAPPVDSAALVELLEWNAG